MNKEKLIPPDPSKEKQLPEKDDFPMNRWDYTKVTLEDIDEIKKLITSGEAICKPGVTKDGHKQLTVYNTATQDMIFYTEFSWQIGQLLEDVEVFNE